MSNTESGEVSEGELEEGEVLSSEDEGCGDNEVVGETEGEKSLEETHVDNGQTEKGLEDASTVPGSKQPPSDTDSPNPKVQA